MDSTQTLKISFFLISGNTEATRVLLEAGANTTTVNKVGRNAAQMGAFVGKSPPPPQKYIVCTINM